jgi:hypothetical protein
VILALHFNTPNVMLVLVTLIDLLPLCAMLHYTNAHHHPAPSHQQEVESIASEIAAVKQRAAYEAIPNVKAVVAAPAPTVVSGNTKATTTAITAPTIIPPKATTDVPLAGVVPVPAKGEGASVVSSATPLPNPDASGNTKAYLVAAANVSAPDKPSDPPKVVAAAATVTLTTKEPHTVVKVEPANVAVAATASKVSFVAAPSATTTAAAASAAKKPTPAATTAAAKPATAAKPAVTAAKPATAVAKPATATKTVSPATKTAATKPAFGSAGELCGVCSKRVYPTERFAAISKVFHKACFKCQSCKINLNAGNHFGHNGLPYCKTHFQEVSGNHVR